MWNQCKGFWYCCNDILSCCKERLTEPVFKKCLFNWDTVDKNKNEEGKLLSFLREDLTFLFRIHANFTKDFENTEISTDLRKVFNDNEHPLSNNAKILTVDIKNEWKIEDKGKVYKIKESKFCKKLNICGPGWTGNPEIRKTPDGKTIRIFEGENLPQIDLYELEEKATLKIRDCGTLDLIVKKADDKLNIYYVEFPHSQWWRVLATVAFVILSLFLWKADLMDSFIINKPWAPWAILSLWTLILYLSLILWLPFHNIWECIEKVDYATVDKEEFREKIRSTLVAFSIAFIVLSLSIITAQTFHDIAGNVLKPAIGMLIAGVILLIVTFEIYDSSLNPAFNSAQIARLYAKGWWLYTIGIYSIIIALLLYVYSLEPLITIIGVILFIVAFTYYLRTRCEITK
jgi:hypothetical protein